MSSSTPTSTSISISTAISTSSSSSSSSFSPSTFNVMNPVLLPEQTDNNLFSNILHEFGLPSNPFDIAEPTLREEVLYVKNLHDVALCELEKIYQQTILRLQNEIEAFSSNQQLFAEVRLRKQKELQDVYRTHLEIVTTGYRKRLEQEAQVQVWRIATPILTDWFQSHHNWPYPTPKEKEALLQSCEKLTSKQLEWWFSNKRKRMRKGPTSCSPSPSSSSSSLSSIPSFQ